MKSKFALLAFLLFSGIAFGQSPHDPLIVRAFDEGTLVTGSYRPAGTWGINCVGSGITCAWDATLSRVTLTVGGGSGSGITQLNGQTGATQTFSRVNDTNVTLTISSAANDHGFTVGWTGTLGLSRGGTNADLSATGGANQFLRQSSAGAAVTVSAIADDDVPNTITVDLAATASALAANGSNCSAGSFPLGVNAAGVAESCTDAATQTELDTHVNGTSVHSATATNTADRIVLRDGSGNFAAGTITATFTGNLTGNVTGNADTATALAANGANCSAGSFPLGVNASGAAESCTAQNGGTDITADLEEEAHATEHQENGADELLGETLGTACSENQILKANASGGLDCAADADSGGSTAFNAIGDAAADGSIDLVATEQDIIAQNDTANDEILEITNQDADQANDVTMVQLSHNDADDANVMYMRMVGDADGTPEVDYEFAQDAATFTKDLSVTGGGSTTAIYGMRTTTATSSNQYAIDGEHAANPGASSSAAYQGVIGAAYGLSGNAQNFTHATHGITGLFGLGSTDGDGTVTALNGVTALARNSSDGGTGTVTDLAGVRILSSTNSGTLTNNYGLLIDNQTAGTNDWAIKTGSGNVEFDVLSTAGFVTTTSGGVLGSTAAAVASDLDTGTDTTKAVTSDAIAGSQVGKCAANIVVTGFTTNTATGDGQGYFVVPPKCNGMNLVTAKAQVITAGTTNTTNVDLARCAVTTSGNACSGTVSDMLSTNITIDTGENSSADASAAAVIDTTTDDIATGQLIRVDVDAVHTTPAKGLIVILEFQLP